MAQEQVRRKLIEYLQDAHAMERNVQMMLNSLILSSSDPVLVERFRLHKAETDVHEQRLRQRLKELGAGSSTVKQLTAVAPTLFKGMLDQVRGDKPNKNARDAFITEHVEIATYELVERLADRAGDPGSAEVARANRADEERMAKFIADNWDRAVDLTLEGEGVARGSRPRRAAARRGVRGSRTTRPRAGAGASASAGAGSPRAGRGSATRRRAASSRSAGSRANGRRGRGRGARAQASAEQPAPEAGQSAGETA